MATTTKLLGFFFYGYEKTQPAAAVGLRSGPPLLTYARTESTTSYYDIITRVPNLVARSQCQSVSRFAAPAAAVRPLSVSPVPPHGRNFLLSLFEKAIDFSFRRAVNRSGRFLGILTAGKTRLKRCATTFRVCTSYARRTQRETPCAHRGRLPAEGTHCA